jgi:dihydropyrimidinase
MVKGTPDLAVRGGTVILESGSLRADVLVTAGRVVGLVRSKSAVARQVIEATGRLILPGGVDAHTHIGVRLGEFRTLDDFASASRAAAFGGTTSLIEFAFPEPGENPHSAVERRIGDAAGSTFVDFGLHGAILRDVDNEALAAVERVAALGAPSVKVFTAYKGSVMLDLGEIQAVMRAAARSRALVMVHAETESLVERATSDLREMGCTSAAYHSRARPAAAELDAARSILGLAAETRAAVYLVHVTIPEVASEIAMARARGVRAFGETCPQYLLLNDSVYERKHPERFVCSPPLRSAISARRLWQHLGTDLTGVHSDHCCFDSNQKAVYASDSTKVPAGLPGVETRMPLMISEGLRGRLPMPEVVRLCSTGPAALFGMPSKGSLLPGMDADLIVVDPRARGRLDDLHMATDYTPFEGQELLGRIDTVVSRGHILIHDGRWTGEPPRGRFIRRRRLASQRRVSAVKSSA